MSRKRRVFSAEFKARVALEAIRAQRSIAVIAAQYDVHPNQVSDWKRQALEHLAEAFVDGRRRPAVDHDELEARLYQQIGQMKVELDWLKKTAGFSG